MILNREQIRELRSAGRLEIEADVLPANSSFRVQPAVGVPGVLVASISEWWPHRTGGFVLVVVPERRLKPKARRPPLRRDPVRLMKPGHGTTADARSAIRQVHDQPDDPDTTGAPYPNLTDSEPELVTPTTEEEFARRARERDEIRDLDRQRRTLTERFDRALIGAERLGVDPSRHLAAIERRITDLEKKLKKAA